MPNHFDVIDRWASQIDGPPCTLSMRGARVYAEGSTIYSYGRHFPMAEIMDGFVLVNGDTFSNTTNRHQSKVRSALRNHRHMIVPHTALRAAGINRQSIRPLEILPDTHSTIDRQYTLTQMRTKASDGWPEGPQPIGFDEPRPEYPDAIDHSLRSSADIQRDYPYGSDERKAIEAEHCQAVSSWRDRQYAAARSAVEFRDDSGPIERRGDYYIIPVHRHWLGESVFSAKVQGKRRHFLSAFDHNELNETYFLCELPTRAETVAQAFDDLAPDIVKRALAMDIAVKRQGDIFAIPCELPAEITRPAPYRRGTTIYDYIPRRPPVVKMAPVIERRYSSHHYRNKIRVETGEAPQFYPERSAHYRCRSSQRNSLLGTDHTATDVLRPETGETYARGIMRHEPQRRAADHARIRLDGWHLVIPNTCPR